MSWINSKCQGAKIKEIRDLTGAQINVSQESLPDSNERTVEVKMKWLQISDITHSSPDNWLWWELPSDRLPCGLHHARDLHQGRGQTPKHNNESHQPTRKLSKLDTISLKIRYIVTSRWSPTYPSHWWWNPLGAQSSWPMTRLTSTKETWQSWLHPM